MLAPPSECLLESWLVWPASKFINFDPFHTLEVYFSEQYNYSNTLKLKILMHVIPYFIPWIWSLKGIAYPTYKQMLWEKVWFVAAYSNTIWFCHNIPNFWPNPKLYAFCLLLFVTWSRCSWVIYPYCKHRDYCKILGLSLIFMQWSFVIDLFFYQ